MPVCALTLGRGGDRSGCVLGGKSDCVFSYHLFTVVYADLKACLVVAKCIRDTNTELQRASAR